MSGSVVVCTWPEAHGDPTPMWEASLTFGRRVAESIGAEVRWLVIGPVPGNAVEVASRQGVAAIDHASTGTDDSIGAQTPDALVAAVEQYVAAHPAAVIVTNQTFDGRLLSPRIAARLGASVVMNTFAAEGTDAALSVTAGAYGGDTRIVYELDRSRVALLSLLTGMAQPVPADAPTSPAVNEVSVDISGVTERVRIVQAAHTEGPRLEDAETIVAAGRGIGSAENLALVEELAGALGGMVGVSRPLVDVGWIDSSHQVGLTGKVTRPVLYIAAGISGATQHMVGCMASKTLVAINTDSDAPIFRRARFGVVDDCLELLPELTRAVKALGG